RNPDGISPFTSSHKNSPFKYTPLSSFFVISLTAPYRIPEESPEADRRQRSLPFQKTSKAADLILSWIESLILGRNLSASSLGIVITPSLSSALKYCPFCKLKELGITNKQMSDKD